MSNLNFGSPLIRDPAATSSANLVRTHLVDTLMTRQARLRLLCAPAGFGKTQLLKACLHQLPPSYRCVWIELTGQPLSLQQLCARIALALDTRAECREDEQALSRSLNASPVPLWLVLDDFPCQADPEVDRWIDRLLQQSDGHVQLVVSSRHRPAWNLARLLLDDQLIELDAKQLAFTHDEQMELTALLAPQASADSREKLWAQTLGWCAGVRLMLNRQSHWEPSANGATPWLDQYLEHALLSRLGERERTMLFGLAHLPRFCAQLCARLWPQESSAQAFQNLLRCQTFFLPLDQARQWHGLLPAVKNALQGRVPETELRDLRSRASHLLYAAGQVDAAIELALSAGQFDVAAGYMERLDLDWLVTEQHLKKLLEWREKMPAPLLESTPRLIFQSARALLYSWRLDEAQACITRLGNFLPQPQPHKNQRLLANWQVLQGTLDAMRGNAVSAQVHCQSALASLPASDWRASIFCYSTLARVAMSTGQSVKAQHLLFEAVEKARRFGCIASEVLINTDRIRQAILGGDFLQAEALLQDSFELARDHCVRHVLLLGRLQMLQGEMLLLQGAREASQRAFELGILHALECGDPFVLHGYLGLCEVSACRGEFEQALLYLHEAERRMHCVNAENACYQIVLDQMRLRLKIRQARWQQALTIALSIEERLIDRLPPLHTPSLPQRNQLLLAFAEKGTGQVTEARERLRVLLKHCDQLQFAVLANETELALAHMEDEPGDGSALQSCTATCGENGQLTSRELSVLHLLAQGLTNQEIGDGLFISLNTVKAHTKNINVKLGVNRRAQAVMQAKALGILA